MVNGNFQLFFWTFTNPIWLSMINLPTISLQIHVVPDQIALYLVSDCSSRYLIGVCKLFLLKIRIHFDPGASRVYTDNAKMIFFIHCEQCNYDILFIIYLFLKAVLVSYK